LRLVLKRAILLRRADLLDELWECVPEIVERASDSIRMATGIGWIAGLEWFVGKASESAWTESAASTASLWSFEFWFGDQFKSAPECKSESAGLLRTLAMPPDLSYETWDRLVRKSLRAGHRTTFSWLRGLKLDFGGASFQKTIFLEEWVCCAFQGGCLELVGCFVDDPTDAQIHCVANEPGPRTLSDWQWLWKQLRRRFLEKDVSDPHRRYRLESLSESFLRECCRAGSLDAARAVLEQVDFRSMSEEVWTTCFLAVQHGPEMLRLLAGRFALHEKTVNRLWFCALQKASKEILEEFHRLFRPTRQRASYGKCSTWLEMIARRSPWTQENSSRRHPPLTPILEWMLELKGPTALRQEAAHAIDVCGESDNWVVLQWLVEHLELAPTDDQILDFAGDRATRCFEWALEHLLVRPELLLKIGISYFPSPNRRIMTAFKKCATRTATLPVLLELRQRTPTVWWTAFVFDECLSRAAHLRKLAFLDDEIRRRQQKNVDETLQTT
jgi:hypothetical protein